MNLKPGDEVGFLETSDGVIVVPIRNILDLSDPNELPIAKEIISEVHQERQETRKEFEVIE